LSHAHFTHFTKPKWQTVLEQRIADGSRTAVELQSTRRCITIALHSYSGQYRSVQSYEMGVAMQGSQVPSQEAANGQALKGE